MQMRKFAKVFDITTAEQTYNPEKISNYDH